MFILISVPGPTPPSGGIINPPWGRSWDKCNICTLFVNNGRLEVKLIPDLQIRKKLIAKRVPDQEITQIITSYKELAKKTNNLISVRQCFIAHPAKNKTGFHNPHISPNRVVPPNSPTRDGFPLVMDTSIGEVDIQSLQHVNYKDPESVKIEPGLIFNINLENGDQRSCIFPKWISLIIIDAQGDIYHVDQT